MRSARLLHALCLLLAVTAVLPAALLARAPACGGGEPDLRSCCCEPQAPGCATEATASLKSTSCGCCVEQPAAPERSVPPSPELASLVALPPAAEGPPVAVAAPVVRPLAAAAPRAAGCELLRLHCVILI